jgi:Sec-independent protein translocase protein TatA
MNKTLLSLLGGIVVILIGGIVVLGTYKLPAPTQAMETQIPNDRLSLQ